MCRGHTPTLSRPLLRGRYSGFGEVLARPEPKVLENFLEWNFYSVTSTKDTETVVLGRSRDEMYKALLGT